MPEAVLALNCGSSSVKFAAFSKGLAPVFRGQAERIGSGLIPRLQIYGSAGSDLPASLDTHTSIISHLIETIIAPRAGDIMAVGHRMVHGGTRFYTPTRIDEEILGELQALCSLAPLHQPHNISGILAVSDTLPSVPQIACFDTAFHRTLPEHRKLLPLPRRFAEQGLRRFGFHGLSYEWIAARMPDVLGEVADGRVIVCHLGNGCSLTGMIRRRSVYTTMGFTPLDGLMMGCRPGRLDPGAVLWLINHCNGDSAKVDWILNHESGLLGVSNLTSDMHALLADDRSTARQAVEMFVDRLAQEIGAAAAAIGGIDAVVFTGGIGENAVVIRSRVLAKLSWFGFATDVAGNTANATRITTAQSHCPAYVIPTDEEAIIAQAAVRLTT